MVSYFPISQAIGDDMGRSATFVSGLFPPIYARFSPHLFCRLVGSSGSFGLWEVEGSFFFYRRTRFSLRLFNTTETELKAIAAPAIIGSRRKPLTGKRIPAAMGMPIKL